MNRTESAAIVNALIAANATGKVEGQHAVWHAVLGDLCVEDARASVANIIATRRSDDPWTTPGDVVFEANLIATRRRIEARRALVVQLLEAESSEGRCDHGHPIEALTVEGEPQCAVCRHQFHVTHGVESTTCTQCASKQAKKELAIETR